MWNRNTTIFSIGLLQPSDVINEIKGWAHIYSASDDEGRVQ